MPPRRDEDEIEEDAAPEAARGDGRVSCFGRAKLFEINVLLAISAACPEVKDAGDLLILRETLLEELDPAYMWLINLSLVDWLSLSDDDKELNTQMRLDWPASYSKASEAVLQHWFWKLLKSKTQNFAPLHHVFVRVRPGSLNCGSDAWTEIFLLYPLTGASIAHKLLARGLQKCLAFKDDSPAACTEYIDLINTSVSQLGHMKDMSVRDVFALVTLMGLYISTASCHQKAYKELLAYVDAGNALTLDDVQHAMIRYSRSKPNRIFSVRARCSNSCPRCCSSVQSDAACNHRCPRCCNTRGRTPDPSSRTSSNTGSRTGSPARRAYPNWTDQDQEALTEREFLWHDRGMSEESRVYASMLVRNVVPEQVLFETGCTDYQDEHATPFSPKLQRTSCAWAVTLPTTKTFESIFLCLYILLCPISWERTGHLIWRVIYLEGSTLGGLFFFFLCVIFSLSCLRGWINFLLATRWSTPFIWRS